MEVRGSERVYSANLDRSLRELRKKVREHEQELAKVSCPTTLRCTYNTGIRFNRIYPCSYVQPVLAMNKPSPNLHQPLWRL
jgi:hypothetical protein